MAAYDRVMVEIAAGIGTVTLNRPEKLNAFDAEQCQELHEALRMLAGSDAVRVIVLTGAGRAFCAGADLSVLETDGHSLVAAGKEVTLTIRSAPQPVLAAVNGPAAGGGANLALACDYRIASDQASIGQGFHKLGLLPDWGGGFFPPRRVSASGRRCPRGAIDGPQARQLRRMDRLLPLLAGLDRPAPRRASQLQVRGEVRGPGSAAHRVRPLQRPA